MKKIIFSLLAVAALASCAKTDAVYEDNQAEIKIKPATALATKANVLSAIDGTAYPTAENFDVYGYWANQPAGSSFTNATDEVTVYLGEGGAYEFTNKGAYWGGTTTYYWPKNGSLRFAAYSPSNVNMAHDLDTDTYTVEGYTQPATTATTWDLLVAPTSKSYTAMTAAENVSVVFEHALSWITVKVVAKDAEAAKAFDIKKVTINDVVNVADFTAVMSGEKSMTWDLTDTTVPYVVYEGSQAVTETATVIETTKDGTVIIPQPTTTITVDYTQNALEGTPALDGQSVTVDLVLDADNTPWEPGKHYVYTLVFGLDEILINPDVVDWEDVLVDEISTDPIKVATTEEFVDAVAKGGQVALQANINLDELATKAAEAGVVLNKDVVIEGNGYTVSTTAVRAFQIINAKEVTIKNLTLNAPQSQRGFQIQEDGQTLVLENVVAYSANRTVNVTATSSNANVTIKDCELHGLTTLNVWGENHTVLVENTTLYVEDNNKAEGYAAVYNVAENTTVEFNGGEIVITGSAAEDTAAGLTVGTSAIDFVGTKGELSINRHVCAIYYGVDRYTYATVAEAVADAEAEGDTIVILDDVTLDTYVNVAEKNITIDLNGRNIVAASNGDATAFAVAANGKLTINGEGQVKATGRPVWVYGANAEVVINGGHFIGSSETSECEVAYVNGANSKLIINGGKFEAAHPSVGTADEYAVLNIHDSVNNTSSIVVNGGSFYKFNPANNKSEGANTNFVPAGKTVTPDGDWFVVE